MKVVIFYLVFLPSILLASTRFGIKEGKSLNAISSTRKGEIIVSDQHEVQIIGDAGWASKVMIYDADGKVISQEAYLISKKFLNDAIESKKSVLVRPLLKYEEALKSVNDLQSLKNITVENCNNNDSAVDNKTYRELLCVIKSYEKDQKVSSSSYENLELLSSGLHKGVLDLSLNSPTSRRHFYSQILHETGIFRLLNEEGSPSYFAKKSYSSKWKGRGITQLTGCSNYINFLLHENIYRAGLEQELIYSQGRREIIGGEHFGKAETFLSCSDSKVSSLLKDKIFKRNPYNKVPFNNPDILKVMTSSSTDLDRLAGGEIKSIGGLSSQDLSIGASIHFWKRSILMNPRLVSSLESSSDEGQEKISRAVNGGSKGMADRKKMFRYTEGCVK